MTDPPTVSIIVPAHQAARTLPACLASAHRQTYRPVEVLVVDDASTDDTAAVAVAAGATLVRHPGNRGVSAARNTGVAASHGEILFFLDADVALEPDAVAAAVRTLTADPSCGCVYGVYASRPLFDDGPVERYRVLHLHSALTRAAGEVDSAVFALAAMPRAVFDELGPFDEKLRAAEDDEYSERLLARHRIRLTTRMVGRHDDAARLVALLAEQFRRAQLMPFSARNRFRRRALRLNPAHGVLAAALAAGTAVPALFWPPLAVVPLACLAVFAAADPALVRNLRREYGTGFLAYALGLHLLVNLAMVAGAATGWVRAAVDPRFGPTHRRARSGHSPPPAHPAPAARSVEEGR
nr:glycosyltransferase family A protein [Micromonospora sp. DSM 115978]